MSHEVDLTNCDREPIHIPGSIQPHGVLLVIDEPSMQVVQVSANSEPLLGRTPDQLLSRPLEEILDAGSFRYWRQQLLMKRVESAPLYLAPMMVANEAGKAPVWMESSIHRHDGALLLQLEPHAPDPDRQSLDIYLSARSVLTELSGARNLADLAKVTAQSVREYTGYDRVVIYKFLEDDSGEVVGEAKRDDLETWMGLRYPASDIPKQARALYLQSWLRIIVDINAQPAPMIPQMNPLTGRPLDMSYCVLRSVSPIHIQYLRNMGVASSMSISLIHDNKLWGLVACHHNTPKQISHETRVACEFLAHSVSLQVGAKESGENSAYFTELRDSTLRLTRHMSLDQPFYLGLTDHEPNILSLFRAGGAAMMTSEKSESRFLGNTPSESEISGLLDWLENQEFDEGLYATDRLIELYPPARQFQATGSGLLAMRIQEATLEWLLWFRPEMTRVVNWAGDPRKPVEPANGNGLQQLSPRRSFSLWREEKHGLSEPWWDEELRVAAEMRRAVIEVVVRKVRSLQRANFDLSRSNSELESFAYAAGHDLKEPLRGIHNYTHMLLQTLDKKIEPEERSRLEMVLKLSSRMDDLIDSLLEYSRVGQLELEKENVDCDEVVRSVTAMLAPQLAKQRVTVRVPKPLGHIKADMVRLREVFQNLITNAAKYNEKPDKWIEVGREGDTFYVKDNGIGIAERHFDVIFRIFRRLHVQNAYGGGTGAGLTIARRVVERHGGKMWLTSKIGEGTTFYFSFRES